MSNHWFNSAPIYKYKSSEVIGAKLRGSESEDNNSSLVLIGINPDLSNLIRQTLFSLYDHFNNIKIVDAGNVRNTSSDFLIPIIKEYLDNGNKIVFLGDIKTQQQNTIQAFQKARINCKWAMAGESINSDTSSSPSSLLRNQAFLGHQIHLLDPKVVDIINKKEVKKLSLGEYKTDYTEAEPFLRDVSALFMDINVTKGSELGEYQDSHPSGLTSEEVCQLTRYAGLSEQCNVLSIFSNYSDSWTSEMKVCKLISQYIWYYLYGMNERREDRPDNSENIVKYIVQPIDLSTELTFLKSKKTGRWWLEVDSKNEPKKKEFISISKKDYEMAKSGNISDRIMAALH